MVLIEFLGPINKESMSLNINSLKELSDIMLKDKELKEWVGSCAVAVNNKVVTNIDYKLQDGDVISILPPVCGG